MCLMSCHDSLVPMYHIIEKQFISIDDFFCNMEF